MNDPDLPPRKQQVSESQLMAMLDFLREHPDLAKGLTRGRLGKVHASLWNQCAKKLNAYKCGVSKDGKGWSRYWCDWKYRTRRRALELRAAKEANRPPPEGGGQLNFMEEKILEIIGENAVSNVVIKTDPLGEQEFEDDDVDNNTDDTSADAHYSNYASSSRGQPKAKRRRVARESRARASRSRRFSPADADGGRHDDVKPTMGCSMSEGKRDSHVYNQPTNITASLRNRLLLSLFNFQEEIALEMVQIEKERLKISHKQLEAVQMIASEVARIAEVMTDIRESLVNIQNVAP